MSLRKSVANLSALTLLVQTNEVEQKNVLEKMAGSYQVSLNRRNDISRNGHFV